MSFMLLGILNSQVSGGAAPAFELISSQILTSSASSVTFSSIPQDYKHLQIRGLARDTTGNFNGELKMRFNGVSTASYAEHLLNGNGSGVNSFGNTSTTSISQLYITGNSSASTQLGPFIIDILDYASTSKNSTTRAFLGWPGSNQEVRLTSGLFNNTAAISSITINPKNDALSIQSGSRFSLYGIRG